MIFKNIRILSAAIGVLLLAASCDKTDLRITEFDLPTDKAYAKFVLLSPGTPSVMIKVNDVKINGATTSGFGGFFPSASLNPDYAAITPNGNFRLSLPNIATANDSVLFFNAPLAMEAGKFYSVTLADTGVDRTVFSIEDRITSDPDSGFMNIRLINAMAKTAPLTLLRVDSTSPTVVTRDTLARNIAFKSASDFIKVSTSPTNTQLRYRLVYSDGSFGPQLSVSALNSVALNRRSVTMYAYGFGNGTLTNAPAVLGFIYNK